ncbi:MAG: GNAT family N-acetyltransferase [Burkholderiales bacterium]|nr:GNAT family N-acetyltransferase [Burkholderiales bacterium]
MTTFRIEKLSRQHAVEDFDCGEAALNRFLTRSGWTSQQANASQTYVALADEAVVGFFTLVVGQVTFDEAPERMTKGLARHPIPLLLIARLAIHKDWQGQGLGAGLLKDAMRRTVQAADIAGIRALAVHAKDEKAAAFYRRFDFVASPTDPLHLFLLIKDLARYANST